jgi:hypothetical protein
MAFMTRCMVAYVLLFLLSTICFSGVREMDQVPTFEKYPAQKRFSGKPAPVDLSSAPGARRFRTALTHQADKGPDFGGHYRVAQWGCGSGCLSIALVDCVTGRVIFPAQISPVWFPFIPGDDEIMDRYGIEYKVESMLFVIHGIPAEHKKVGDYYYVFNEEQFSLVYSRIWESTFNK